MYLESGVNSPAVFILILLVYYSIICYYFYRYFGLQVILFSSPVAVVGPVSTRVDAVENAQIARHVTDNLVDARQMRYDKDGNLDPTAAPEMDLHLLAVG